MQLKYGKKTIDCAVAGLDLLGKLDYTEHEIHPVKILVEQSFLNPIAKPRLRSMLHKNKPGDLVILISDITRSIANYSEILECLVSDIIDTGIDEQCIEFVIALGTHRKHTIEENRSLYGGLISKFKFSFHDCRNDLVSIGKTSTGLEVRINKRVKQADFVLATGRVDFHYLAGFSGGRKSILPGISAYETIQKNHSKLRRQGVALGNMRANIIAQEMDEAAKLFGIDYLLNIVETPDHKTANVFCGDAVQAHNAAIDFFKKRRMIPIKEQADCAIVSAGGYPQDRTFYDCHKALNHVVNAVKPGGAVILVGSCADGIGNENFLEYMRDHEIDELLNYPESKIEVGGHRAFQTSKLLKDYKIYVVSDLDIDLLKKLKFLGVRDIDTALKELNKKDKKEFKVYVVPNGRAVLPILDSGNN